MLFASVKRLVSDSIHGGLLKGLALAARLTFFVVVVPYLLSGELAVYVFVNSTALIAATVLIFGLNEELPRVIEGNYAAAHPYLFWFYSLSALSLTCITLAILFPGTITAGLLLSVTLLAGRFLGGIVRSIDAAIHERLQNLPWVLFIGITSLTRPEEGTQLIVTMACCMNAVQWYCLYLTRSHRTEGIVYKSRYPLAALWHMALYQGSSRLLSNLFVLGFMRGLVLWPVWIGLGANLDEVAFAIAVGGVVSQFGLIPANRAYARWCRSNPLYRSDWKKAIYSGLVLGLGLAAVCLLGLAVVNWLGLLPPQVQTLPLLIQALVFYSLMPAFRFMRYLAWSRGLLGGWIAGLTGLMFMLTAMIVWYVPVAYWFISAAGVLLLACVLISLRSKEFFPPESHTAEI
jgi:hypothetical protein